MRTFLLFALAASCSVIVACGDETSQEATTTDETYTTSVGDEDPDAVDEQEADDEALEPAP